MIVQDVVELPPAEQLRVTHGARDVNALLVEVVSQEGFECKGAKEPGKRTLNIKTSIAGKRSSAGNADRSDDGLRLTHAFSLP